MKSMLFSALVIFALASTGCALQTGSSGCSDGLCGQGGGGYNDCMPMSGDCGCPAPRGISPSGGLVRKLGDNRGMGLRLNQKGAACNQNRGSGLFSRMRPQTVAPAASMGCDMGDCGCDAGDTIVSMDSGDCGCGEVAGSGCGCGLRGKLGSKGCGCGLKGKLGGCCLKDKLGGCCLFGGKAKAALGSGCGVAGCGVGGAMCGGCLAKLRGAHQHPYGGAVPHTAQAPGNGTGMAPSYAYPYYTTRGPRDFLMKNPPSIGY